MRLIMMMIMQMKIGFSLSTMPLFFELCKFSSRLYIYFQLCIHIFTHVIETFSVGIKANHLKIGLEQYSILS